MILIADCGSTKIDWCIVDNGRLQKQIFTTGINAVMLTEEEIRQRIADELVPHISSYPVDSVYFYGAGCLSDEVCGNVARAIRANLPSARDVEVHSDLLAAARALCGHEEGVAAILGTGSNSCYYDGVNIVDNVSPLGYILGDEGSGAVLGRQLIGDVLKRQLPLDLCDKFLSQYELDRLTIIRRVYKEPAANRFLASVTPFLSENIDNPEVSKLVVDSFRSFFVRNVMQYEAATRLPIGFVGSIAYHFEPQLEIAADSCGLRIGTVLKTPMPGLIDFHSVEDGKCK